MKLKTLKTRTLVWLAAAWCASAAQAQEVPLTAAQAYVQRSQPLLLAEASAGGAVPTPAASVSPAQTPYEPPLLSASNAHLTLGIATILAAAATAATAPGDNECEVGPCPPPPPRETNGTHAKLAKATIALAAATVTSGLLVHWDDFHLEDGFTDPDNLHVMLGVTGAALMAYAVNKSAHSSVPVSHAGMAELGALGMVAAIKMTW